MKPVLMANGCLQAAIVFYLVSLTRENPGFLLFAEYSDLWQLTLHDNATVASSLKIPLTGYSVRPQALDYNFMDGKVYWTDVGNDAISRSFLDGSSEETIVSTRLSYPNGLAVDPFGQNVYWTERYEDVIEVASLNGLYRRALIKDDLQYPSDIVLDVTRGFMYWTHSNYWSRKPKIERADLDGDNRRIAIQLGCYGDAYPSGLALDVTKNWLYWVDSYHDKLEVYEFPTNTRREIIRSDEEAFLRNPTGLALFRNHIFWTDSSWNGIYRMDRETGDSVENVLTTRYDPVALHAYDKSVTVSPVTNQCSNNNGGCSQLCVLTPFGRKCLCSEGLILKQDGKTCHAPPQFLLFADASNRRIMKGFPQDSLSFTFLPLSNSLSRPVAVAYDFVEDRVYWTDVWRSTISRSFLNGSSQEVIIDKKLDYPYGLAVDFIGRNLYWADTYKLGISKLDGSHQKALITTSLYQPKDIILDVNKGIMYWTNWNNNPKIEKAEMTGKNRVVIVSLRLQQPNGLTLDRDKNRLYWVDASYHVLEYLDLNLNNRVTLISSYDVLASPFGLTLLGDTLYWTDTREQAVYQTNVEIGSNVTIFFTGTGQLMDIHGYNLSEYSTPGNSPCQLDNGGCSHICLLSSSGSECACPAHLSLREDGKTCYYKYVFQKFLLYASGYYGSSEIYLFPLDGSESESKPLPIDIPMYRPVALGMDITENRIYWTDTSLQTISRVFINGSSPEVIISESVYYSYGLAVDPIGRNIYWTDTGTNTIEVSRMDGTMRKVLIHQDLDDPRDIILDLRKGLMYWSQVGQNRKIEVANMDGDDRRMLVRRGLYYPNGLTLDDNENKLYWVDELFEALEYYDLQGHTVTTLLEGSSFLRYPFGLTSLDDHLYWTDLYRGNAIFQANKTTPSNVTVLVSGLTYPMGIHAYDRNKTLPDHPCSSSSNGCSHLCLLRPDDGYRCSCPEGLSLLEDGKTCTNHSDDFQKFILFAEGYYSHAGIFLFPLNDLNARAKPIPIELSMGWPAALSLDITENRIYWTDAGLHTISRVFINGSSPEVIISGYPSYSYGLAVDPLGRNIYWTDTDTNTIEVSRMNGTMRKTLIDQDLDDPRDIILDLRKGLMYWSQVGQNRKIEVANMDGDGRKMLVRRGLYYPNGLALDDIENKLYWVDGFFPTLEYYDLQRHTVKTLLDGSSVLGYPFGLTSLDDHLYWTDRYKDAVFQANKATPSNVTVLVSGMTNPMDVHAYDRNKTLPDHPCSSSHGGCSHLCLLRPDGYHCSCPDYLPPGEACYSSSVVLSFSATPANTVSNSNHRTEPLLSMSPSASHKTSVPSIPIRHTPTQTVQQTTVSSSCEPTSPVGVPCTPNACKNGGTCVTPGNYCKCQKIFAWHDCSVDVGSSTVEIELTVLKGNQWNLLDFKIAIATACTEFFCKAGDCSSKSKSGREKRSQRETYFQPSDIVIPGISSVGENTLKVEFVVLFPAVNGQAPQPSLPVEIIQMLQERKETIEKAVGGTIKVPNVKPSTRPGESSEPTKDKGKTTIWIAAGVGSFVVLVIILMAFVVYRVRRKRSLRKRNTERQSNVNTDTQFDNPTFDQDSIYDSVSKAKGSSVAPSLAEKNERGSKEHRHQSDQRNEMIDEANYGYSNRTYQALDESTVCSPTYNVAYSGDRRIESSEKRYASLQQKGEQQNKEYPARGRRLENPSKQFASLQRKTERPWRDGHDAMNPGHFQAETRQHASDAATDDEIYENLQIQDGSEA